MTLRWIRGGRTLDPATGDEAMRDLFIENGRLVPRPARQPADAEAFDAAGYWVVPGLIDLHVHLREPGGEAAETIATGTAAAAAGGFQAVVSMANTFPPIATPDLVRATLAKARAAGYCAVWPAAALTADREGRAPAPLADLAAAGAAAFTDDGNTVADDALMRRVMAEAARLDRPVLDHAQDHAAERRGVMHEGAESHRHGLPGIPAEAETRIIARDIALARETGAALHIQHISSAGGVDLIRRARAEGLRVTAEATPHHLALCDADMDPGDADWKMNPPLRSADDREAIRAGAIDGTLPCFATDHAPHRAEAKALGFAKAPFGIVGLETAVGATYTELVRTGWMDRLAWLRRWTAGPAAVLGRPCPALADGAPANLAILELETPWIVDPARFLSRSRNTPFKGRTLVGRAVATVFEGRVVWTALPAAGR